MFDKNKLNTYLSIILGLGISLLFKKICKSKKCFVIKAPNNILNYTEKKNGKCFKFKPFFIECNK